MPASAGSVKLSGLGKAYRLYPAKWGRAAEWMGFPARHSLNWVLRDVDLDIAPGEALGIVGENGAGKSTLLKLITGVSRPTAGALAVTGRVSALLELGIGFRDTFTGRQNAIDMFRLNGVPDDEIPALLRDTEAFADLGQYFEFPVRTYSSGMQCRLAFAAATAIRPDILIVDEALAVGDIFFQQRCYDRISAFRELGTTLLFVSHSAPAVFALCDRAVLLSEGRVAIDGAPREVLDLYNAQVVAKGSGERVAIVAESAEGVHDGLGVSSDGARATTDGFLAAAPTDEPKTVGSYTGGAARLEEVALLQNQRCSAAIVAGEAMTVRVRTKFTEAVTDPHIGLQVRGVRGDVLYRTHTHGLGIKLGDAVPGDRVEVDFTFTPQLAPGDYTLTIGLGSGGKVGGALERPLFRHQDVASFSLLRSPNDDFWDGVVNLRPKAVCRRLEVS